MAKSFKYLSILILILFSCEDSDKNFVEEELLCDNYYLEESNTSSGVNTKFYYNSNGQLTSLVIDENEGYKFSYTNNRLTFVTGINSSFNQELIYNDIGKLIAGIQYIGDIVTDSVALEYDVSNNIVKREFYEGIPLQLKYYLVSEYIDMNTSTLKNYHQEPSGSSNFQNDVTLSYVYDTHKKPLPFEYYLFDLFVGNAIGVNNIVNTIVNSVPEPVINTYTYNQGEYPTKIKRGTYEINYKYSCSPILD